MSTATCDEIQRYEYHTIHREHPLGHEDLADYGGAGWAMVSSLPVKGGFLYHFRRELPPARATPRIERAVSSPQRELRGGVGDGPGPLGGLSYCGTPIKVRGARSCSR